MTKYELLHTRFCQEAISFGAAGVSRPGREGRRYTFAVFSTGTGISFCVSLDDTLLDSRMDISEVKKHFSLKELQQLHAVLSKVVSFYFLMNTILEKEKTDASG